MDNSKSAVAIFNKWAKEYQDKFMNVEMYAESFNLFCNSIMKENAAVLELACGPGNITKFLLNKRPDLKILGTDLAPKMIALAKINNPTAVFKIMDCRDISKLDKKFDAIMCGFAFPYLSKEEARQLISDANNLLEANGIIYISTMEDDYTNSGLRTGSKGDQMYMHYHQADYLTEFLIKNNFSLIDLRRIISSNSDGTSTTDLLMLARKNPYTNYNNKLV